MNYKSTKNLRSRGGWIEWSAGLVDITGADNKRFLQSQTSNDLDSLAEQKGQLTALLDRKARPQAIFWLYRLAASQNNDKSNNSETYRVICPDDQKANLLAHLELFKFRDIVEFHDLSSSHRSILISGPRARRLLSELALATISKEQLAKDLFDIETAHCLCTIARVEITGEDDFLILIPSREFKNIQERISSIAKNLEIVELTEDCLNMAILESGLPRFMIDFDQENLLAETGLEEFAVSYTKGCFQGQEVLARIRSLGAPTRALAGALIEPSPLVPWTRGEVLKVGDSEIGVMKSNSYSDFLDKYLAIVMVKKDYRAPGKKWTCLIDGEQYSLTIETLPHYRSPDLQSRARQYYDKALQLYARATDKEAGLEDEAINLLHEALYLDPCFEDAYETLGVILSKSKEDRLDEAIELMRRLAELNPDSIMAHANLSTFYMQKGWKEKAEEELAESMSIRMRQALKEANLKKEEESSKETARQAASERMEMFARVLEIDSEDLLANNGMGESLVVLERFDEAIPYLVRAIEIKNTHSVAYLSLGKAYEGLANERNAIETYEKGIDTAAARGDMEPLKKMRERLQILKSKVPN